MRTTTLFWESWIFLTVPSHGAVNYISPADLQIVGPAFQKPVSPSKLSRTAHLLQKNVLLIITAYFKKLNEIATYIYDKLYHKTFWRRNSWKITSLKCYPDVNKIPSVIRGKKNVPKLYK